MRRYRSSAKPPKNWFRQDNGSHMALWATGILVETLLEGGAEGDVVEAERRSSGWRACRRRQFGGARHRLLRLRALLARARGETVTYADLAGRYREMAESLGFEGHIDWAEAMIEENDDGAMACESCGTNLRENAKFCDECGGPIAVRADTAEYKQVTVLFADVVRSMDIAAALDIERLREVMTELLERAAAVARRYGGSVEYNGDGVMAMFGAPIALEDHAFRACCRRTGHPGGDKQLAAEVAPTGRCDASGADWPEFGPGDRW